jgi:hypothetical protein
MIATPANWSGERHQFVAQQHQFAGVAIIAVAGVFEAEGALQAQPSIRVAAHAKAGGMHALVQPDHARRFAGVAAQSRGDFGGGAAGVPPTVKRGRRDE